MLKTSTLSVAKRPHIRKRPSTLLSVMFYMIAKKCAAKPLYSSPYTSTLLLFTITPTSNYTQNESSNL